MKANLGQGGAIITGRAASPSDVIEGLYLDRNSSLEFTNTRLSGTFWSVKVVVFSLSLSLISSKTRKKDLGELVEGFQGREIDTYPSD